MAARNPCHFKLVLLGDTAVGKSCLVVRFVRDEFFEYQEPTIGGALQLWLSLLCCCAAVLLCARSDAAVRWDSGVLDADGEAGYDDSEV